MFPISIVGIAREAKPGCERGVSVPRPLPMRESVPLHVEYPPGAAPAAYRRSTAFREIFSPAASNRTK